LEQKPRIKIKSQKARWVGGGIIGLLLLWLGWSYLPGLLSFVTNRETVVAYMQGFGIWGAVVLLCLMTLQVAVAIIPGQVLLMTSGYLYGFGSGLALNLLGNVVASQLAFVAARWGGRPLVERLVPAGALNHWRRAAEHQGVSFYLFFFWFPIIPTNLMNFVAGLGSISFWRFLAANFFGRLPGLILITLIGAYGVKLSLWQGAALAVLALVLVLAGRYATGKLRQRYFVEG